MIEGIPVSAVVELSGKPLVSSGAGCFDITELLAFHNRLTIELAEGTPTGETECPFDVRLEIFAE